ncbi:MAG: hypothetical protein ACT4P6_11615 [Gemmatimonadaceae bacterium]
MKASRTILGALSVVALACGRGEQPAADTPVAAVDTPAVPTIELTASDFAFQGPDTVQAGPTWIRMANAGKEFHHVIVFHLADGHTFEEFLKAVSTSPTPPEWAHPLGGPIAPSPGGAPTATAVNLGAGTYALICVVPSADGVPHIAKGMARQLTVVPQTAAAAAAPITPTSTITLADYSFTPSTPLSAGKNIIRVVNSASQPHEVVIVRLFPGKTVADIAAFGEKPVGEPPGEVVGGASFIAGNNENFIDVDLTPGDYGFICFVPDAKDGKPHVAHGMIEQFKIG